MGPKTNTSAFQENRPNEPPDTVSNIESTVTKLHVSRPRKDFTTTPLFRAAQSQLQRC
jgi:hypothetical protein